MKGKALIIGIIVAITLAVLYVLFRQQLFGALTGTENGRACVNVSPGTQTWQGDMKADWGAYGPAKEKYLGVSPESTESEYIDGFFKAIDAQPNSKLVRKYASQIRAWLDSGRADKHWMVELGELRCKSIS